MKLTLNRTPAGISLVEMMITLTILAVVALALADGLVTSMRTTSVNEERAAAMRAAREKLEWVMANKQLLIKSVPQTATPAGGVDLTSYLNSPPANQFPRFVIQEPSGNSTPLNGNNGVIVGTETASGMMTPGGTIDIGGRGGSYLPYDGGPFDVYIDKTAPYAITTAAVTGTATSTGTSTISTINANSGGGVTPQKLRGLFSSNSLHGTLAGDKPGEIVVMYDEQNPQRADFATTGMYAYGRDLTGGPPAADAPFGTPDGQSDGVNFPPVGDMDMDGQIGGGGGFSCPWDFRYKAFHTGNVHGRVPVGVIIRWAGSSGKEERVELWTVINFFQENFGSEQVQIYRYD